jgi:hypothetical protein
MSTTPPTKTNTPEGLPVDDAAQMSAWQRSTGRKPNSTENPSRPVRGKVTHGIFANRTRAAQHQPSLVLIDELDSIAPSRSRADAQHQQSLVAQLLVLLDGLEGREGIAVLATTNRPRPSTPPFVAPAVLIAWCGCVPSMPRAAPPSFGTTCNRSASPMT